MGFSYQALGTPLTAEKDSEFERIALVSQVVNIPLQIIILSYQGEVSYTVMDLLNAKADTYYTLRETLDAMEDVHSRAEQE